MATVETIPRPAKAPPDQRPIPGSPDTAPRRWKWTGRDLIRMGEAGLLPPEGRFELLDGEIYELMPPGPLHAVIVELIQRLLDQLAQTHAAHARSQNPIHLNEAYDPQPDVAVVRGQITDYRSRFPEPAEVLLAVEVADSSLEHDRDLKLPAYATWGVLECWIVNLPERQAEVYREPADGIYRMRRIYKSGETIEPLGLPGGTVAVADLLGEAAGAGAAEAGGQE